MTQQPIEHGRDVGAKSPDNLFADLASGRAAVSRVAVARLFALASEYAVAGHLDRKNVVLSQWVKSHPAASASDLQRVEIHEADWLRRQGNGKQALEGLRQMADRLTTDPIARVEYLQALNQCLLQASRKSSSAGERLPLLVEAVRNQETLVELALPLAQLAPDKKIYYLIGLSEHRRALMSALGQDADPEIERALGLCEAIASSERLDEPFRQRARWEIPFEYGMYLEDIRRFPQAAQKLSEAVDASMDIRSRTATTIHFLFCCLQTAQPEQIKGFAEAKAFFSHLGDSPLLPGDKALFADQLAFVRQNLTEH